MAQILWIQRIRKRRLLAKAVGQRHQWRMTNRVRQQAGSYRLRPTQISGFDRISFGDDGELKFGRRSNVGARLPAIAVGQPTGQWLALCIRGQARSYSGPVSFKNPAADLGP